jgi:hypothetical protein
MITAMAMVTLTDMTRIATTATMIMGIIMTISRHERRASNGLANRKNAKSLRD